MSDSDFRVDAASARTASQLTNYLRRQYNSIINQTFWPMADHLNLLNSELNRVDSTILTSLSDIEEDCLVFTMLTSSSQGKLPALRMGANIAPLPLLPPRRNPTAAHNRIPLYSPDEISSFILNARQIPNVIMWPVKTIEDIFFDGLSHFLGPRIAGIRWAARLSSDKYAEYGLLDPQTQEEAFPAARVPPGGAGSGVHQMWTVETVGRGHSLYRRDTHAARPKDDYLNAPTTPLNVALPMGTFYLGADAGQNGAHVFDTATVITVPSYTPHFKTRKF